MTSYRYDPTDMMMYTDVHMLYVTDLDYNYIGVDNSRAAVPIQIWRGGSNMTGEIHVAYGVTYSAVNTPC